jgi:hypothetical protein
MSAISTTLGSLMFASRASARIRSEASLPRCVAGARRTLGSGGKPAGSAHARLQPSLALHVDTCRIRWRDEVDAVVLYLQPQLAPARHDLDALSEHPTEHLSRPHGLVSGLPVDLQDSCESEDQLVGLLQCHASLSLFHACKLRCNLRIRPGSLEPGSQLPKQDLQRALVEDGCVAT